MSGLGFIIVIIILAVIGGFILWYFGTFNGIKTAELKVSEALSGIDVALTKRYDVLTKMLETVKAYKAHEFDTLTQLVNLRRGMSMNERNQANASMDQLSSQISLLAENYPELRSSANFAELQKAITDVEEHLQAARRLYNANVTDYNKRIVTFPSSIVAGMMGAVQKPFFEAEPQKRQDVNMVF